MCDCIAVSCSNACCTAVKASLALHMEWVTSHVSSQVTVTHFNQSRHMYQRVMLHTSINQSRHTYQRVMSHIWMSHVPHIHESCRTYEWVMSHISTSHVPHMNESWHTYERVMSHIWTSHVTHINESCHTRFAHDVTYYWVTACIWILDVKYQWVERYTLMNCSTHICIGVYVYTHNTLQHTVTTLQRTAAYLTCEFLSGWRDKTIRL